MDHLGDGVNNTQSPSWTSLPRTVSTASGRSSGVYVARPAVRSRATRALDDLDKVDFDPALHASEFLRAYQLVTAVKEVLNTPVLDPDSGELTEASIEILRKYA